MTRAHTPCSIIPPYLLEALASAGDPQIAERAQRTLDSDHVLRSRRHGRPDVRAAEPSPEPPAPPTPGAVTAPQRVVSEAHSIKDLPGEKIRGEGDPATDDEAADEAYDGLGQTWALYEQVFSRNSLDGRGLPLLATVHYGSDYDNAFWDGTQMVFGDGDGKIFQRFTRSLDVIGHELTHGVTELTAGLTYQGQPGALNESISDVFGSLVKQHALGQRVDQADWLIGAELFTALVKGVALRSMKAPGTAYGDAVLGKDPQPAHMRDYVNTRDDNGGVHINSGIPNHAFYLAATAIGGRAWEETGWVWFAAMTGDEIKADCDIATFAGLTVEVARQRYGGESSIAAAVAAAWSDVGVTAGAGSEDVYRGTGQAGRSTPGDGVPAADTELFVRRTGGFAGLVLERRVMLGELPERDWRDWQRLLTGQTLQALAQGSMYPDAFCYGVQCEAVGVDVQIPEPALSDDLRTLFDRTLEL